ncbi:hypothetical protein BX600DRAFT_440887 [Xylariales sp. PMI_506]|nr:hypothetical protein BX600DRAFT_440887 [Xylariales sp. PMI_506]
MASQYSFYFGIEIELLIGSRSRKHKTWKSIASEVSHKLAGAGIPNHINEGNDKSPENYGEWSIVQEVTVPSQPGKNLWGLELVSPILDTTMPWAADLAALFSALKHSFILASSSDTSTHIHMSTSPPLSPEDLASICRAILYFEPALDLLLPSSRASSYWCQSNRANPTLCALTLPECFDYLDSCCSPAAAAALAYGDYDDYGVSGGGAEEVAITTLAHAMCSFPARSAYGRAHGFTQDFLHGGVYKWNLAGLASPSLSLSHQQDQEAQTRTLEFRQCPGATSAEEATTWLALGLGFVAGTVALVAPPARPSSSSSSSGFVGDADSGAAGLVMDPEEPVAMEDLWWLISAGVQQVMAAGEMMMQDVESGGAGGAGGSGEMVMVMRRIEKLFTGKNGGKGRKDDGGGGGGSGGHRRSKGGSRK